MSDRSDRISTEFWVAITAGGDSEALIGANTATAGKRGTDESMPVVGLYTAVDGVVMLTHVMTAEQALGYARDLRHAAVAVLQARGVAS